MAHIPAHYSAKCSSYITETYSLDTHHIVYRVITICTLHNNKCSIARRIAKEAQHISEYVRAPLHTHASSLQTFLRKQMKRLCT